VFRAIIFQLEEAGYGRGGSDNCGLVCTKLKGSSKIQSSPKCKARKKFRRAAYVVVCKQEIFSATQHNQPLGRCFLAA
jgi:hypothetical protein